MRWTSTSLIFMFLLVACLWGCKDKSELEKRVEEIVKTEAGQQADGSRLRADARLCEEGDPRGCADLAVGLDGVYQVDEDAVDPCFIASLYEKGCKGDEASACFGLARYNLDGVCVEKDVKMGQALLSQACSLGEDLACGLLETVRKNPNTNPDHRDAPGQ